MKLKEVIEKLTELQKIVGDDAPVYIESNALVEYVESVDKDKFYDSEGECVIIVGDPER